MRKAEAKRKTDGFESMSLDELWAIHEEIASILRSKIEADKLKLERRLAELSLASASESNGNDRPQRRRPYPKVQPKYRNPDRPSETWSGRGKQPRWVSDLLQSGKNIEDLLI
jgi:DNA-binding protein H-NS